MMPCLVSYPILHLLTKLYVFAMQGSSRGDNAEIFGMGPSVAAEEGIDGDTSGSDLEGIDFEGDLSSVSEDNSSDEADEERYKELEDIKKCK